MTVAEVGLVAGAVLLPVLLGVLAAVLRRPWWWAAVAAVVLAVAAAVAPPPEPGESRLVAGDLGFLAVLALVVTGLTWIGYAVARRVRDGGGGQRG